MDKMLTDHRRTILELLVEYAYLSRRDFYYLIEDTSPSQDSHERKVRRVLQSFNGCVNRAPIIDFSRSKHFLTYQTIFWLTSRGLALAQEAGIDNGEGKANDEHSPRTLDHEYEITKFHLPLKTLARQNGYDLYWQQRDLKKTIFPDALFALGKGEQEFYYFLEIEKSKAGKYIDGEPQILRKLSKYYSYYNSDLCEREWKFRKFRVIVVVQTDARRKNLLNHLRESFNHPLFWISTAQDRFSCFTPRHDEPTSLFEAGK
ncbi:MAG TPA: replication-relaxation family protein [Candidatus Sulfotelmatobacter sp.]|nr:replication-relaxation family protein [Candidatus Sulfotelmatobacter sp.]